MARRDQGNVLGTSQLEAQTECLRNINRTFLALLVLGLGVAVVASALPQRRGLAEKEQELREMIAREREARSARDASEVCFQALKDDPQYLETLARDRLDYCRPDERVLRIQRESH